MKINIKIKLENYFIFKYNYINILLLKLEIIKLFKYNKYRNILFYKIIIEDIEGMRK